MPQSLFLLFITTGFAFVEFQFSEVVIYTKHQTAGIVCLALVPVLVAEIYSRPSDEGVKNIVHAKATIEFVV
jgi:hypothetical protein